ncbi:hypothetical protein OG211_12120 [Streptomyces niveus]|uniref:hypothetical protein n=1 Tax=Streptomyces niveus TaxID=193462 RepID=UPI00386D9ABD|nr:hypothetical protein OG211_12120 [Streptomyces niveus]
MSRITGCVGISLASSDRIETAYRTGPTGMQYATLRVGLSLGIDVADASPDVLRALAAAADELADWREAQDAKADVAAQVDAEDGVRNVRALRPAVAA